MNSDIILEKEIKLYTPLSDEIEITLKDVEFKKSNKGFETCFIYFKIDYFSFQDLCMNELLNLYPEIRNEFIFEELETDVPVEIEAILRKPFVEYIRRQHDSGEKIVELFKSQDQNYSFLFQTESWLPLTISQKVNLPDDMDKKGTLKLGYRTLWYGSPDDLKAGKMHDVVQLFFLENKWKYEYNDNNIYRIKCRGDNTEWIGLIRVDEENKFCMFYSVLPELVPENMRTEMAEQLIHLNYDLGVGSFEMDMEDGEVRFRTSIDVEGDRLNKALFQQLISINMGTLNKYIDEILDIIKQKV